LSLTQKELAMLVRASITVEVVSKKEWRKEKERTYLLYEVLKFFV